MLMKMMYAIHTGCIFEDFLSIINMHCFDNINGLIGMNYLKKEGEKVVVDIPVITITDRWKVYELSKKYYNMIAEKYHDEFFKLMKKPVKLPAHLKSVPEWQRYMWCCSSFPMMVILNAIDNGLFLKDVEMPVPAVFLATE